MYQTNTFEEKKPISSAHVPRHKVGCKYVESTRRGEESDGGDVGRRQILSTAACHKWKIGTQNCGIKH